MGTLPGVPSVPSIFCGRAFHDWPQGHLYGWSSSVSAPRAKLVRTVRLARHVETSARSCVSLKLRRFDRAGTLTFCCPCFGVRHGHSSGQTCRKLPNSVVTTLPLADMSSVKRSHCDSHGPPWE